MKKKINRSVPHEDGLLRDLKDPEFAAYWLSSIMDGLPADEASDILVAGIVKVAKAQGMTKVAIKTGMIRESLYQSFKKGGNPTLSKLHGVLDGIGVEMTFKPKKVARAR